MSKKTPTPRPLSDEHYRRIIREELDTNLLVEAGAGSGKTHMLAARMAAGVATGAYQIEHMAAVTFTRKAASELRGRLHLALEERLQEIKVAEGGRRKADGGNATQAERLLAALGNMERFFAGTIHSFCARLLRERPVESGVSPGFTELDEVQDEELRNRAWRDFITSARAAGDSDMLALLDTGVRPNQLDDAFARICLNDDVEFPAGDGQCPDPKPAWKALEKFWAAIQKELPREIADETTCDIQKAARDFRAQLHVARKRIDRPAVMADLLDTWDVESKIIQKWWADSAPAKRRFRDTIEPLHAAFCESTVTPYLSAWRHYVYRLAVTVLVRARSYAADERRRRNSLNYGDLLNLTAKVLRENAAVRRALQQKYRYLFVDEFQDTDPVQAEIVFLLAADEPAAGSNSITVRDVAPKRTTDDGPRTTDWRTVRLRRGALFVVGDPKQSIYRFRRADIEIYNTVRDRFSDPTLGRVVPLTTNFRSVPALCEWANEVFDGPFPSAATSHSPQFARLDPSPEAKAGKSGGVFTLTYAGDSKAVAAEDAARIARYIRSEVDARRRRFSDFLILTRKKKDRVAPYAAALEALNIPLEVSGAGAFGESEEVKTLTTLLRVLADPQDPLPLVNILRGPLFGISDPELFEFKQSGGWLSIFAGLDDEKAGEQKDSRSIDRSAVREPRSATRAALAALARYHRWTRFLPAGAALDKILEHSGFLALASITPGGVEAGDLLHAVDRVRQIMEEGGSLSDAAAALEADGDFSTEVESLPLEPGRTDVVRLMNLHKAKGLEADVVFLADPNGGMKPRVDGHIERTGDRALGWFKVTQKFERGGEKLLGEHKDWPQHEAAELPFLAHEQTRLLYVAATRARSQLVISRHERGTAWGLLNEKLATAKELQVPASVSVTAPVPDVCSLQAQAEAHAARVAADGRVNQPSWLITSVTAEAKQLARLTTPAEPLAPDDATTTVAQSTSSHRADVGMAWGTLIHGLLEHAMRHPNATRDDLRRLAMWLTVEEPQLRPVLDEALDTVEVVSRAQFWREAKASEHYEEAPFAMTDGGRTLTNGVIDLIFTSPEGWQIRDYKTDTALDRSHYARQLDTYCGALLAVGLAASQGEVVGIRVADPSQES